MLKFGIRQAGGCGRRPKNAKPTTKPNVQTQKKGSRPPKSPRGPPEAPGGTPQAPGGSRRPAGGPRRSQRRPKTQKTPTFPWKFGTRQAGAVDGSQKTRNPLPNPTCRPKKRLKSRASEAPPAPQTPPKAPEAPGRFRSSKGHNRKSPQPFRKIPKGYRSARDKTLDQSQADKGGSGNLGRQPETRKGIKLGGCLRKQGVGERNQHTSSWFVAHERCAVA